jgi:hypothetical protein
VTLGIKPGKRSETPKALSGVSARRWGMRDSESAKRASLDFSDKNLVKKMNTDSDLRWQVAGGEGLSWTWPLRGRGGASFVSSRYSSARKPYGTSVAPLAHYYWLICSQSGEVPSGNFTRRKAVTAESRPPEPYQDSLWISLRQALIRGLDLF